MYCFVQRIFSVMCGRLVKSYLHNILCTPKRSGGRGRCGRHWRRGHLGRHRSRFPRVHRRAVAEFGGGRGAVRFMVGVLLLVGQRSGSFRERVFECRRSHRRGGRSGGRQARSAHAAAAHSVRFEEQLALALQL